MIAPLSRTAPRATGNGAGRLVTNRVTIASISRPRMESTGPHMPASHRNAVPPGKICSSAVCVCVCVPTTALTWPSRNRPMAIFSLVVSAWTSTKITGVSSRNRATSASTARNGIFQARRREGAALHVDHGDFALRRFQHDRPRAGRAGRVVERAQQSRLRVDVAEDFLLIPDVVAAGDDRRSRAQQFDADPRRDAAPVGGVLAVDDEEVDPVLLAQARPGFDDRPASRFAHHVA